MCKRAGISKPLDSTLIPLYFYAEGSNVHTDAQNVEGGIASVFRTCGTVIRIYSDNDEAKCSFEGRALDSARFDDSTNDSRATTVLQTFLFSIFSKDPWAVLERF